MLFHILCMVNLWDTMVYLFQSAVVFYLGFPVSKHHSLPWFPWFIMFLWFTMVYFKPLFTMVSLFQNNIVVTIEYDDIYFIGV